MYRDSQRASATKLEPDRGRHKLLLSDSPARDSQGGQSICQFVENTDGWGATEKV